MMSMDNMIISGVRIYFPPGKELPETPSSELRTFAIVSKDLPGHMVLMYLNGCWKPILPNLFEDPAHAIAAITKLRKKSWR